MIAETKNCARCGTEPERGIVGELHCECAPKEPTMYCVNDGPEGPRCHCDDCEKSAAEAEAYWAPRIRGEMAAGFRNPL